MYDIPNTSKWTTISGLLFTAVVFFSPRPMRRWLLAMFGGVILFLFTVGRNEGDVNAMGQAARDQAARNEPDYFMTPLSWLVLMGLLMGLCLYPFVLQRVHQERAIEHLEPVSGRVATRPPQEQEIPREAPVYTAAAPDPAKPERPFYVPTVVGSTDPIHSEVGLSGVVINEHRTFDRETE